MRDSSWALNNSWIKKLASLALCVYSATGYAQDNSATRFHAASPAIDIMSGMAMEMPSANAHAEPGSSPLAPANTGAANPLSGEPTMNGANGAIAAAVADGVTTGLALSSGAVELNPIMPTSPLGLVVVTGMKIGLVKYAETLPEEEKRLTMKTSSAFWGGAAINNLMVLFAAPPPLPVIAGLLMGLATWNHMENQYEQQDRLAAARQAPTPNKDEKLLMAEEKPETVEVRIATASKQTASEEIQNLYGEGQRFSSAGE